MSDYGTIRALLTDPLGGLHVTIAGPQFLDNAWVRVEWDDVVETVRLDGTESPLVTRFESGQVYTVTLTVILSGGRECPPLVTTMVAGTAGHDVGYLAGVAGEYLGYGLLSPVKIAVAVNPQPDPPAVATGPAGPAPVYALVGFSPLETDMPVHPSVQYDPTFDPYALVGSLTVNWLYFKEADGTEVLRLVAMPEGDPALMKLGPDGSLYFLFFESTPSVVPDRFDTRCSVCRATPVEYGVTPPPPTEFASYQVYATHPPRGYGMFWSDEDEGFTAAVLHKGTYITSEDRVIVVDMEGSVANMMAYGGGGTSGVEAGFGTFVFTDQGVFVADGGNPI